jgi:hypothetical protein
LSFGRHTFCLGLMSILLNCSHDLMPERWIGAQRSAVNGSAQFAGEKFLANP